MRAALAQFDIVWEDPKANLQKIKTLIPSEVDLLVLPEMFLTGFSMQPHAVAETMQSDNLSTLQKLADDTNTAIMGSLAVIEADNLYNRMLLFSPNKTIQYYDKRHLFSYGGEGKNFTPGENQGIFQLKDWTICARICYDLRFPVWCRNTMNYDLIVFVASWPKTRHHAWTNLVQARAIENQAYAIGVNRTGRDGNDLSYKGGSIAVDYNGDVIAHGNSKDDVIKVTLDKTNMLNYRKKLPFLNDQDKFILQD